MSTDFTKREVKLKLFQDDANGEWGFTHVDTWDDNYGNGFNAFWDGRGIFHDVFEHWFENVHPYFMCDNAMNVGGEMAAMGARYYFYNQLGVYSLFNRDSYHHPDHHMIEETASHLKEAVREGECRFGHTLNCGVPRTYKVKHHYGLDSMLNEYWYRLMKGDSRMRWQDRAHPSDRERYLAASIEYRKSVTYAKIRKLHHWGYEMAEKSVPDCSENREAMEDFIAQWDKFCKANKGEDLSSWIKGCTIKLDHAEENEEFNCLLKWEVEWHRDPGIPYDEFEGYLSLLNLPKQAKTLSVQSTH